MRLKFNKQTYETKIIKSNLDLIFPKLEDELKNTQSKITYVCKEHGEYSKRALELFNGKGCSKCGYDKSNMKKTLTIEQFISKSKFIHNDKYNYDLSIYNKASDKIKIICPIHGIFEQRAYTHMQGSGCKTCGFISSAKKNYLSKTDSEFTTLYYIKCYGKEEIFYKIGIAVDGVLSRYANSIDMPYMFEVLREIRGNTEKLLEIEESIKLAIQPYTPLIPFGGSATECTKEPIDLDMYLINT